jgi:hypothetical protein
MTADTSLDETGFEDSSLSRLNSMSLSPLSLSFDLPQSISETSIEPLYESPIATIDGDLHICLANHRIYAIDEPQDSTQQTPRASTFLEKHSSI